MRLYSLFLYRQSAGSLFQWTLSSVSPKTLTRITGCLFFRTGLARWCILLRFPSQSRLRDALVSLSTRYVDSKGYPVNLYPTTILGSRRTFGKPCSALSVKRLKMFTFNHSETDFNTERANRVLQKIFRGYVHSFSSRSEFLPMVDFAINNLVHASTQHTPFVVNNLRHPLFPPSCSVTLE